MAKKKSKQGTEHRFYLMPDHRVMRNPGLTEELTGEELTELVMKGWVFNIPKVGKTPKGFIAIEPFPDDHNMLGITVG